MGKGLVITLTVLAVVVLAAAIYFSFFFDYNCDDKACFQAHQQKCSRTNFINDIEEATWEYNIKGKNDGACEIEVKMLQIKEGTLDKKKLEGLTMICTLPIGSAASPESDIGLCHGELKEEMQNLIIQKLHYYIIDNIGQIDEELENPVI